MFEQIKEVLLEYVDVPADSITPDTRFLADLHMNSMDIMTMICQLEDAFDIEVVTEDLQDIFTIQELIDYIKSKQ